MRSRLFASGAIIAVAAVAVAGCGSKKKSTSTAATPTPAGTTSTPSSSGGAAPGKAGKVPSRSYTVKLNGKAEVPAGAPKGTGKATVSLRGKKLQVCWKFSALRGFAKPTAAHIHQGAAGTSGPIVIPFGAAFTPKGCTTASAALIRAIAANPKGYYVNVHTAKYPGGAVRSQL
jgi:hypothetical protein